MNILDEASKAVDQDRQASYGSPLTNHQRIAAIWGAILGIEIAPEQVALCMIGTKLSRLVNEADHIDSIVDIAGYARTYQRIKGIE